jgi:hypothetical protein
MAARAKRKSTAAKGTTRGGQRKRRASPRRWSQRVTQESDALDLKRSVFTLRDPKKIAASLKRSALASRRRGRPMSFGAFDAHVLHQPRRGKPSGRAQAILEKAKTELRAQFRH